MFNKKINKILAVNLALGLSFVGCNFRAVDTKPHGILEWVKVNSKKSVLIGLISLLGGAGSYLGYKGYQYSHVKFYDNEKEAEEDLKKVKSEYQSAEFEIRKVHSTSKDTDHKDGDRFAISAKCGERNIIISKNGQIFYAAPDFCPKKNLNIYYIVADNIIYIREGDLEKYNKKETLENNSEKISDDIEFYTFGEIEDTTKRVLVLGGGSYKLKEELCYAFYVDDNTIETKDGKVFVFEKNFDPLVSKNVKHLRACGLHGIFFVLKEQS
ncbi:MAG: hypothetical protein RsTaC01_0038 [Candidatus Paraimprobicoccus trichonymphae]|uniref:Lipoprotein n=1 Tax=Candidatus Paraimprobicoccus trichonymphae TaxID=3033793 RepID=A0AA48HZ12_9FIRM|nr:MAG: hypothetical protein RsTaC01_0038 [Candidatus Paraimprobicoccus trichonymphae]